jgi:spermidine synthase
MKGLWFSELQSSGLKFSCLTKKTLYHEITPFQELAVIDTETFGRMLLLDGVIQTNIRDEFVYHEMISLVAINTHANPVNVLVIGGGDGGTIREIIKHPKVKKATLVEIDGAVIEASKKYLPEIAVGLSDPKVEVIVDDGIKHIQETKNHYEIIIVDSTDPVGPAVGLFAKDFYQGIYESLREDGIFVAQTESPFFNEDLIRRTGKDIADIFPIKKLYVAFIPTYPGGMWSFTMGSKKYDPEKVNEQEFPQLETRYYTPQLHKAAFVLPKFVKDMVGQE